MSTLDPTTLIMCSPKEVTALRSEERGSNAALPPILNSTVTKPLPGPSVLPHSGLPDLALRPPLDGAPYVLNTPAGTVSLGPDGIARIQVREGYWVDRGVATAFLGWINSHCPDGAPLLVDKRKPYALDFSAQQAIEELMRAPASAILIPSLDKMPLAEYARETYMRRVETRIFRSEAHALRWLSTFVTDAPAFLPAYDLIQAPVAIQLD